MNCLCLKTRKEPINDKKNINYISKTRKELINDKKNINYISKTGVPITKADTLVERLQLNSPEQDKHPFVVINSRRNFGHNAFNSQTENIRVPDTRCVTCDDSAMSINIAEFGEYKDIGIQAGSPLRNRLYQGNMAEVSLSPEKQLRDNNSFKCLSKQSMERNIAQLPESKKALGPLKKIPTREKTEKTLEPMVAHAVNKLPPVDKAFLLKLERENIVGRGNSIGIKTALEKSRTLFHMNITKIETGNGTKKKSDENMSNKPKEKHEQKTNEHSLNKEVEDLLRVSSNTEINNKTTTPPIQTTLEEDITEERSHKVNINSTSQKTIVLDKFESIDKLYNEEELDLIDSIDREFNIT